MYWQEGLLRPLYVLFFFSIKWAWYVINLYFVLLVFFFYLCCLNKKVQIYPETRTTRKNKVEKKRKKKKIKTNGCFDFFFSKLATGNFFFVQPHFGTRFSSFFSFLRHPFVTDLSFPNLDLYQHFVPLLLCID